MEGHILKYIFLPTLILQIANEVFDFLENNRPNKYKSQVIQKYSGRILNRFF